MEKCNHNWHYMEKGFVKHGGVLNPKGYFEATFICDKCGERKEVIIKGTEQNMEETCSS